MSPAMPAGSSWKGSGPPLVFSRLLVHPPEAVWRALTDPDELSNWYMTKAAIDGHEGGSIDFLAGPSRLHVTGRILRWEPPLVFEHEWKVAPRPEVPTSKEQLDHSVGTPKGRRGDPAEP